MPRFAQRRTRTSLLVFVALTAAAPLALAQPGELLDDLVEGLVSPTQTAEESAARSAEADANFDAIMLPQNEMFEQAKRRASKAGYLPPSAAAVVTAPEQLAPSPRPSYQPPVAPGQTAAEVEVPLDRYADVRARLEAIRDRAELLEGPTVTIGSSEFTGEAIHGALKLNLKLQVTLGKPDGWKTVPLVGDDVVLVRGTVDGKPIPVSRQNGYHVWVTRRSGEIAISIDLLVPSRGPRGSLEYDFLVARTPVTRFSCRFPGEGLEPRLDAAMQSEVQSVAGFSVLDATLRPTTRIHLVGFKDLGEAEDQTARIFAESLNLLSVDEGELDLFAVIRYTILYAGAKHFDVQIPPGMTVVTADGEGAYRFTIEKQEGGGGTVLRGETAFPIRNNYEVSLRLKRQIDKAGEAFAAPLPRCLGVEREHGWLAVEVPGKLKLTEVQPVDVLPVDVRQLPGEMVRSAVSPIIRSYRYHSPTAAVQLSATRLPDVEPASGSVDRIRAFTVLSNEGKVLTDLRITLRNRLRPSLELALPADVRVRSVHLDGEAIQPSRSDGGALMLPLKKSSGGDRLQPFTLQIVTETEVDPLGVFGGSELTLPAVDLPVSTVSWTVFLPSKNVYSALEGDVEPQQFATEASWHRPAYSAAPVRFANNALDQLAADLPDAPESAGAGLMGVRIELPRSGTRLDYSRYWIEQEQPLTVSFSYLRGWLMIPAGLLLVVLLAAGCLLFAFRPGEPGRTLRWLGVAVVAFTLWPLNEIGGTGAIFAGLLLGVAGIGLRRGWLRRAPAAITDYARTLVPRIKERDKGEPLSAGQIVKRSLIAAGLFVFGTLLLGVGVQLAFLLTNPL